MQLIVDKLSVERGGRLVLNEVSFSLAGGETLLLTGENGAGKTTLLRAIVGHLPLVAGAIRLDGGDADARIAEQAHAIGHANAVKSAFTVRENLTFWHHYFGASGSIDDALAAFALEPLQHYPVSDLSAGQKRRVGLARLIAAKRPLWLLDEPTTSLDTASSALITKAINTHVAGGGLAVVATHLPLELSNARELRLKTASSTARGAAA